MTEDVSIGMKPPHRDLFMNAWKDLVKEKILEKRAPGVAREVSFWR